MLKEKLQKFIKFENDILLGIKDEEGKLWLAVSKTIQNIGLNKNQADRQTKNVKTDLVLSKGQKMMSVKFDGDEKTREMLFINEEYVTLWLAKISLTPIMQQENPEAVDKLIKYQLKCAKVLHEAFFKTEEQKQETFDELGLKVEIKDLKIKIEDMDKTMGTLINSATINSYQAKQINKHARDRVSTMLGGAHSKKYKDNSRTYFKNLWLGLCDTFNVSEYRDLNPLNYNDAVSYVSNWSYN